MSSSSSALPTPRQLLTSILNSISEIPAPTTPAAGAGTALQGSSKATRTDSFTERAREPATNPLKLLDPRHRPLFTTLHVLFPSLLLPALDLLDRGLVTRLVGPEEAEEDATAAPAEGSRPRHQDGGPDETRQEDGGDAGMRDQTPPPLPSSPVYLVRSAQKPPRRPYGGGGGGNSSTASAPSTSSSSQRTYVVHTAAWNCTCAAFAFSAFPPLATSSLLLAPARAEPRDSGGAGAASPMPTVAMAVSVEGGAGEEGEEEGEAGGERAACHFGGLSFDGTGADVSGEASVPPCCKHLLACVLAERWGGGLGRYVSWRTVGREEMAGVFADV
ncbi:Coproporphyrinogen-III oxidase [Diaporthe australafricana]|uniref:Coproporphyrinogen-III oxidase n=1 Tax=Diaporthe australafricana TaxID=127596 RepID=A0ABR3WNP5_9PEZI